MVSAVRWHAAGDVRLDEVDNIEPGEGQVEIAVVYCGVCGSDLHEILDGPHAIPVDVPHPLSRAIAPIVLGHEFSGIVTALGAGVEGLAVGDAVVVEPNYRCGQCSQCRAGRYHTCTSFGFAGLMGDGGLAHRVVLPAYMIHPLPVGFDLAVAAVLEPAAVALHAVRRSSIEPGGTAAVVGLGPVGLLVGLLLRNRGARTVVGIDPTSTRRDAAVALGFDVAVNSVSGIAAAGLVEGVDVAFEVAGNQDAFDAAISCARVGGEVLLMGLTDHLTLSAFDFVNDEKTVRSSVGYNDCHGELIELVQSRRLDLSPLISRIVSLQDAPAMLLEMARSGSTALKTLIHVNEEYS